MKQQRKSARPQCAPTQAPVLAGFQGDEPRSTLQAILSRTISALTDLDAERLEGMVLACECLGETVTADDVKGALDEHRALELLLAETERNLRFLTRVCRQGESPEYAHAGSS
jgi:hypothetical protein